MELIGAIVKLWRLFRTAVLWDRANRAYGRAIKHIDRGLELKNKGDMYSARAEKLEKQGGKQ